MDLQKDYYSILNVDKNVSDNDLKKIYRKLSMKYHPDKNGGKDEKFKDISEAYSVLSGKERQKYDTMSQYGKNYTPHNFGGFGGFDTFGGFGGFDAYGGFTHTSHNPFSHRKSEKLNIEADIHLSLEDVYNNTSKIIKFKRKVHCDQCNGTGKKTSGKFELCKHCNGLGINSYGIPCDFCEGKGKIYLEDCTNCNNGLILKESSFNLNNIYKIKKSDTKFLKNFGHQSEVYPSKKGDLILNIKVKKNNHYEIRDFSLYYTLDIHFQDMIDGVVIDYEHLDGKTLKITIPKKSNDRQIIRIKNKGLLKSQKQRGDLYFILNTIIDYDKLENKKTDE